MSNSKKNAGDQSAKSAVGAADAAAEPSAPAALADEAASGQVEADQQAATDNGPHAGQADSSQDGAADTDTDPAAAGNAALANPAEITVWPIRTFQDAGELKRRGGPSYTAPRRHAEALKQRGLVSLDDPKA